MVCRLCQIPWLQGVFPVFEAAGLRVGGATSEELSSFPIPGRVSACTQQGILCADQIGFHLVDWQADAAFIVALSLYPERFTDEEIREGVLAFLLHAPSHVVEAARLAGQPCDTFVPAKEQEPNHAAQTTPGSSAALRG